MTDQYWSPAKQDPAAVPFRNKFDQSRDPLTARNAIGAVDSQYVINTIATSLASDVPVISASPPASPTDGQLWVYQPGGGATGTTWVFRYNAGSGSAYKWEFVGGPALSSGPLGSMTTNSATVTDLTSGPSLTMARAGDYWIGVDIFIQGTAFTAPHNTAAFAKRSSPATDGAEATVVVATLYDGSSVTIGSLFTGTDASAVFNIRCNGGSTDQTLFSKGILMITPIRVI